MGGPIALIEDGDTIVIDAEAKTIDLNLDAGILEARRAAWRRPPSSVRTGLLAKFRAEVTSASEGAVTVAPDWD